MLNATPGNSWYGILMCTLSNFQMVLNEFTNSAKDRHLSKNSINSYRSYLSALDSANSGKTLEWIKSAGSDSTDFNDFIAKIRTVFDGFVNGSPGALPAPKVSDIKSAFTKFAIFFYSYFDATADILWATSIDDFRLAQYIAETAIFATPDTVKAVIAGTIGRKENKGKGNPYASWDNMSSIRDIKNKKQNLPLNGKLIYRDDNTRANIAIKSAVLYGLGWSPLSDFRKFHGFEACHIYDKVSDPRYYTSIMNLILVPRSLAALTDFNDYVKSVLKYRVFTLFNFTAGEPAPTMPHDYQKIVWR